MAISRQQEHFVVMTIIYDELSSLTLGDGKTFIDARDLMVELCECPYSEVSDYVKDVVTYSINHYGEIIDVFTPHLRNWKWDRLPLLTQSILIMSYAHSQIEKIDKAIIISVAINLAKKYIGDKQAKFINGILNEVL